MYPQSQSNRGTKMTTYQVENTKSAVILGAYEAASPEAALDAMAQDAGYRDYAHALETVGGDPDELLVTEIAE
jgi:hypothetical protein